MSYASNAMANKKVSAPPHFKQSRAQATYEALLEAAAHVFAKRGYDAAQTPEIAAAAGVSTGALYRYFSDKRQMFIEIAARRFTASQAEVFAKLAATRFEAGTRRQGILHVIDIVIEQFRRHIDLEREVLSMSLRDSTVEKLRTDFERAGVEMVAGVIEQWTERANIASPRAAALMLHFLMIEMAADRSGLRPQVAPDITDGVLREALADLIERYLFPAASAASSRTSQPSRPKTRASRGRGAVKVTRKPSSSRRGP